MPTSRLTWAPEADERDRIDYVFYQPDERLQLQAATVVGPRKSIVRNQRVDETGGDPFIEPKTGWPTDHKSVMATFVIKPLALTLPQLAGGKQNVAYAGSLAVLGGTAPYAYSIVAGSLPPGMQLGSDGSLSGTPTVGGRFSFTVQVKDAKGSVAEREYQIDVAEQPESEKIRSTVQMTSSPNPSKPGEPVTFQISMMTEVVAAAQQSRAMTKAAATPTGSIDFTDNGAPLASVALVGGQAQWTAPALAAGTHNIVASYSGDGQFAKASMAMQQVVTVAAAVNPTPVPTLNDYVLWLLAAMLMAFGMLRLKR